MMSNTNTFINNFTADVRADKHDSKYPVSFPVAECTVSFPVAECTVISIDVKQRDVSTSNSKPVVGAKKRVRDWNDPSPWKVGDFAESDGISMELLSDDSPPEKQKKIVVKKRTVTVKKTVVAKKTDTVVIRGVKCFVQQHGQVKYLE